MSLDLRNPGRTIHAGVVLTKGVTELLDVAPFEFFSGITANSLELFQFPPEMRKDAIDIELHWVTETGGPVLMKSKAQIIPTDSYENCPPLDIVLMGAHDVKYHISPTEAAFIRKAYENCTAFLSVCGGIFAMLEAGLLEGLTVTAPRMAVDMLKKNAPHINWVDKRWTHDGKVWSSSTLLNGTDLIRGFATEIWGGRNGMVEALLDVGHWPQRDNDFKDFNGHHYVVDQF